MEDHADNDDGDGDIFIYMGGRAPQHVTHVLIDRSVDEIEENAFENCRQLLAVETHDGIRKIGTMAFFKCESLPRINIKSADEIEECAFFNCVKLESIEFGDRLETIGAFAFGHCTSLKLKQLKLPSIVTIESAAFLECKRLIDVELSERVETIGTGAFYECERLQRIAIPPKRDLFGYNDDDEGYTQFDSCEELSTVDLVGGIHKTVASLHMESWRAEMLAEINRINQVLPNTLADDKTDEIHQWMEVVIDKIDHYKAEHCRYVREGITILELALWKAKLGEKEECEGESQPKKAKVDVKAARRDKRITCGADIVIKNVLPFLQLE